MQLNNVIVWSAVALILARWVAELWLSRLNSRHVLAHANKVPEAFRGIVDEPTYKKSVAYTLAKARFGNIEETYGTAILLLVVFGGVLPFVFHSFERHHGTSAWSMAGYLFMIGIVMSLPGWPLDWYS
ncbi:MAG: endopeptidase, partial [Verrucomicrobiota bacterium]